MNPSPPLEEFRKRLHLAGWSLAESFLGGCWIVEIVREGLKVTVQGKTADGSMAAGGAAGGKLDVADRALPDRDVRSPFEH